MRSYLTDAEWEEEVRAAAVCGGGPNAKLFQAEMANVWMDDLHERDQQRDWDKYEKPDPEPPPPVELGEVGRA